MLTENQHSLVVKARLTQANRTAEREAALATIGRKPASRHVTGADRGYDTRRFVTATRELNVPPHVAQNESNWRSAVDELVIRHAGYALSQRKRKRVEEVFGWMKKMALQRKTRFRESNAWAGYLPRRLQLTTWFGCAIFRPQTRRDERVPKGR